MKERPDDWAIIFWPKHWNKYSRVLLRLILLRVEQDETLTDAKWTTANSAATLLSYFLWVTEYLKAEERQDGWFYRFTSQIHTDLRMPERTQQKAIDFLIGLGYLEKERRGVPGRRWMRVRIKDIADKIWECYREEQQSNLVTDGQESQES